MAYTLQSLITVVEKILNPEQTRWIVDHNKPQLQSLLQKSTSLQQVLEKFPLSKIESLESQIRDATHIAEDIIESHMVDQMFSNPEAASLIFSTPDLQQAMQQLDSSMEQVVKLVKAKTASSGSSSSGASFSHNVDFVKSKVLVGVDEDLRQLTDRLMGMQSKLEIVPIVGMGGIGKTTLARKLYEDPSIVSYFQYAHAWATISQEYNMKTILLSLLRCIIGKECDQHIGKESDDLKDILYRSLFGRRYMIVLDDIWSLKFWDEIRMYLPDNNKGSRIVITSRESDVAKHANSQSVQHQVQLLSESTSWDLLRQIVFGEEKCPHFLQEIGEKIASDCGGLPLAISVIGGLLTKVEISKDGWENIANNVASAIAESDKGFSNILSLSYNHLPNYLKPCFLYIGAFPEDYEIETSELVHMWVAEGFVKSNGDKSLEEEAENYLKALLERNILLVRHYKGRNGKAKRFNIHDLLRDLCLKTAYEDKFLYVKNSPNVISPNRLSIYDRWGKSLCMTEANEDEFPQFYNSRRLSVGELYGMDDVYDTAKLMSLSLARSFLSIESMMIPSSFLSELRLVRVLDVIEAWFPEFPIEILELVNLRFLAVRFGFNIPSGISRLWNLQTLIARTKENEVPFEIWELNELRHLKLVDEMIWFPDEYTKQIIVHKTLQTISLVFLDHSLIRMGFFESIPNIKDLAFFYNDDELQSSAVDLSHLHKLETLRCQSNVGSSRRFWSTLKFPFALKKLTLDRIAIFPRVSTLLCALPNLEVLKLKGCGFKRKGEELEAAKNVEWEEDSTEDADEDIEWKDAAEEWEEEAEDEDCGALSEDEESEEAAEDEDCEAVSEDEEWEIEEGHEFRSLQFLSLANLRLKRWRADETNFPKLHHLCLTYCNQLEEIPSGIGEISTLQLIKLERCNDSVVASAKEILDVQSDYGNYDLKLHI